MVCFLSITALPAATILNVVSPISFYLNSLSLSSFYLRNLFYLIPLGVVHEVIASGRCLICLVHRNPVHAPAGIHQRPHVIPVAPIEPQEHPVIVIIPRRYRALAESDYSTDLCGFLNVCQITIIV